MRKVSYVVNGIETKSYREAREVQPREPLKVLLKEIVERKIYSPEHYQKVNAHFAKMRAEKAS